VDTVTGVSGELSVVVFDVNETLFDMAPMAGRFAAVGADEQLAQLWFASLLRDGFALAAAGAKEEFGVLAEEALNVLLAAAALNRPLDQAVAHVLEGFKALRVHPDVVAGVGALRAAGLRLVTLTNGSTAVAGRLLAEAGVRDAFEMLLSVDDAPAWKPARESYDYAARTCGTPIEAMLLVAVHPWDIDGAARAGMRTAWLNRRGLRYPGYFTPPTFTATTLVEVAEALKAR
jgi:2-haloacid dehalogenase